MLYSLLNHIYIMNINIVVFVNEIYVCIYLTLICCDNSFVCYTTTNYNPHFISVGGEARIIKQNIYDST